MEDEIHTSLTSVAVVVSSSCRRRLSFSVAMYVCRHSSSSPSSFFSSLLLIDNVVVFLYKKVHTYTLQNIEITSRRRPFKKKKKKKLLAFLLCKAAVSCPFFLPSRLKGFSFPLSFCIPSSFRSLCPWDRQRARL